MVIEPEEAGLGAAIERYVRELTAAGAIRSPRVERAFRAVHRHQLLETFYIREPGAQGPSAVHHDPASPHREQLKLIYSDGRAGTGDQVGACRGCGEDVGVVGVGAAGQGDVDVLAVLGAGDHGQSGVHGAALGRVIGDRVAELGILIKVAANRDS